MSSGQNTYGEIEIGLQPTGEETYHVEVRVTDPSVSTETAPQHARASIRPKELRALYCDSFQYGERLTDQLFADPKLRASYRAAKERFDRKRMPVRLRLLIDTGAAQLNTLRWELLLDPNTRKPLATSARILFSRFMLGHDRHETKLRPKAALRAVIAVSAPTDVAEWGLAPIDKSGEVARAREALAGISVSVVAEDSPLTLVRLTDAMRQSSDIVYLVCHGALPNDKPACLYLQNEQGKTVAVTASDLAQRISELKDPPRLIVLASCESASREDASSSADGPTAQSALAPLLAEAGIPAVIAMQGKITMETVKRMMPKFFHELAKDGQIDRAVAVARGDVRERDDNWMPALFIRLKDGRIWAEERRPQSLEERNRREMLKRVRMDWIDGVLKHSLYEVARIELQMEATSGKVERSLNVIVQAADQPQMALPAGTSIAQVFEENDNSLLILGAPGTGKTTLLLELAEDLLNRAELDDDQLMPVVFNLSSWAVKRQELAKWMIAELNTRSEVPKAVAQQWVENDKIIPLLDGLDEVAAEHRDACVEAINAYRRDHGLIPIAVCSRVADYESLKAKLRLRGAVMVQALSKQQVENYLARVGGSVRPLQAALQNEPSLWELVQTPLMLWVALLAYRYSPGEVSQQPSPEQQRNQLFARFVDAMFKRRAVETRYSPTLFLKWLSWLANRMKNRNQSVFYLEDLQAKWLPGFFARPLAGAGTVLGCGLIFGIVLGPAIYPVLRVALQGTNLQVHFIEAVIGGMNIGICLALILLFIDFRPVESVRIGLAGMRLRMGRALRLGLLLFVLMWPPFALLGRFVVSFAYPRDTPTYWGALLDPAYLCLGLFIGLIAALSKLLFSESVESRARPNQGTRNSLKVASAAVVITGPVAMGLLFVSSANLRQHRDNILLGGLTWGLTCGVFWGGLYTLRHYVLRLVVWLTRAAPLNYVRFLDASSDRLFLRKVGGGYIFTHRLLMEYFASLVTMPKADQHTPEIKATPKYKEVGGP